MTDSELRQQLECEHTAAFGWALACCRGDRADAEDVLHDAYLAVLSGKARFDSRSTFRTWLFGVIRLTAASGRRRTWLRGLLLQRNRNSLNGNAPHDADSNAERHSRDEKLRALLNGLAERQRQVLHLVFYQELTIEEAAKVLGISVGSARTHYTRGKSRLAQALGNGDEL